MWSRFAFHAIKYNQVLNIYIRILIVKLKYTNKNNKVEDIKIGISKPLQDAMYGSGDETNGESNFKNDSSFSSNLTFSSSTNNGYNSTTRQYNKLDDDFDDDSDEEEDDDEDVK